ncbi:Rieske (2Fe-2S) protein [Thermogemmatispora carboxidivorans]|uniref:Rieske (2Fe-2S) protein n=1 Tax=Thermogemmatispora carboxidivorans TaxID=1382306 RepID=UPI00069B0221|nr:Rieske 2Fe-2S domain-containing protein [Thermogemmatispora carboxidivorans]
MKAPLSPGAVCYNLGHISRIPRGEGRTYRLHDRLIAVFRSRNDELFATQADCPHRGGPLADGIIGDGKVICPLHAFKFDLRTGAPLGNTCPQLHTYPVRLDAKGNILVTVDDS